MTTSTSLLIIADLKDSENLIKTNEMLNDFINFQTTKFSVTFTEVEKLVNNFVN